MVEFSEAVTHSVGVPLSNEIHPISCPEPLVSSDLASPSISARSLILPSITKYMNSGIASGRNIRCPNLH